MQGIQKFNVISLYLNDFINLNLEIQRFRIGIMLNIYTDASSKQDNAIAHVQTNMFAYVISSSLKVKCTYQANDLSGMFLGNH